MSEKCKVQESLCRCVDWHEGETADWVDHLLRNYEFERLTLDYSTLEKGTEIRLCQIGQCSKCGGQICIGTVIHPCELLDDTLARVYAEASKRWRWYHEDEDFDEVFIQLFRGRDQRVARLWLDLVRAKAGQNPTDLKSKETTLNIRLSKTQVEQAENILSKLGLSMSEAVSLFLAQVLWDGLPFGVALPDPDDREYMNLRDMSLHADDMAPTAGQLSLNNEPEIPWDKDVSAEK